MGKEFTCPLCDTKQELYPYTIESTLKAVPAGLVRPKQVKISIFRCNNCSFEITDTFFDPLGVQMLYQSESIYSTSDTYQISSTYPQYSQDILSLIKQRSTPQSRILEIGCFTGNLLFELSRQGFHPEGVELDPIAAETARTRGLKVTTGDIFMPVYTQNSYDMIIGVGVLEHIPNPIQFVERIASLLSFGGYGILQYPNRDSLNAVISRYSRHGWDMYAEPGHLTFFSKKNIIDALNKCGLVTENIYTGTILSRGKIPFIPWRSPKIESKVRELSHNPGFYALYKYMLKLLDRFNLGDTQIVIFKKVDS